MKRMQPSFKAYQQQIVRNAAALAEGMKRNGFRLVSGGTDNHLMLVDVGARGVTGKECQAALDQAGITVNKNTIPFETRSPFQASGIRLGTPAVTTRGMKEAGDGGDRGHDQRGAAGHQERGGHRQGAPARARADRAIPACLTEQREARQSANSTLSLDTPGKVRQAVLKLAQDFPCHIEG